ncbi:predicted protein [Plenodomus lingam JN3]|uniref:Predicted protein n=1 Tax=Leptosphaeria maculans (strain JN3 / isolate v23.1.3 / race Av1-4-5-6-7-8) TaxID=985895 RepID=E5R4F2_LEPMJ|nr:predicted protein [Plenodomus lingam JN3]CBX91920.1 predicted protein [Plenodomus lingam JN3]
MDFPHGPPVKLDHPAKTDSKLDERANHAVVPDAARKENRLDDDGWLEVGGWRLEVGDLDGDGACEIQ